MKNIHVLPTDKPSRLYLHSNGELQLRVELSRKDNYLGNNQDIYITSDEEINQQTKPCWCINTIKNTWDDDLSYYQGSMPQYHYKGFKKIILTTDQDLIKDGVQAIDDEFLEWFVKNPSCEEVEVEEFEPIYGHQNNSSSVLYKTIIPKEEPKQLNNFGLPQFGTKEFNDLASQCFGGKPKQQTLEEAVNNFKKTDVYIKEIKQEQERSYSEEEVLSILQKYRFDFSLYRNIQVLPLEFSKWFEQFKKK